MATLLEGTMSRLVCTSHTTRLYTQRQVANLQSNQKQLRIHFEVVFIATRKEQPERRALARSPAR
jgi:hypothetical protein